MWQFFQGYHDEDGGGLFPKAATLPPLQAESGPINWSDAALTAMQDASRLDATPKPYWIQWISRNVHELFDAVLGFSNEYLYAMHGGLISTSGQHAHED